MKLRKTGLRHLRQNAVGYVALFAALGGGTAIAATGLSKGSVGPKQIKTGAVNSAKVRDGSLKPGDLAPGTIPAATAAAPEVVEKTFTVPALNPSPDTTIVKLAGLGELGLNCNTSDPTGTAILYYSNDTSVPISYTQEGVYDGGISDNRVFGNTTIAPAGIGGDFSNSANTQKHEIELVSNEASPKQATINVTVLADGGNCTVSVTTIGA